MLMRSSDTNHVLNEHDNFAQHHPYAVPSKIMHYYSFPASLVAHHSITQSLNNYRVIAIPNYFLPYGPREPRGAMILIGRRELGMGAIIDVFNFLEF